MPRHIPGQVTQSVSRLLEGKYIKSPPAWYDATLRHPPVYPPPLSSRVRPDSDLPRSLQSEARKVPHLAANKAGRRSHLNSLKKLRSQLPPLRPQPIVYEGDRIRRQFFRDHPWEAKRPRMLTETDYTLEEPISPTLSRGQVPELHMWSRINPSVEDVVQCTLKTAECTDMSLSQAYRRTIASYHAIQAEREHRMRHAILEARSLGAEFGPTETERGFIKESRELDKWAALNQGVQLEEATETPSKREHRVKRTDMAFTNGAAYMDSAQTLTSGQAVLEQDTASEPTPQPAHTSPPDDYLGIASRG